MNVTFTVRPRRLSLVTGSGSQSYIQPDGRTMRRQSVRNLVCAVITVLLVAACAAPGWADRGAGYYIPALLLPGYGQSSDGHYTKGAVIAGVAVAGWIGLFATQINYNRAVEQYDIAKSLYLGFGEALSSGTVVQASAIEFHVQRNAVRLGYRRGALYTAQHIRRGGHRNLRHQCD